LPRSLVVLAAAAAVLTAVGLSGAQPRPVSASDFDAEFFADSPTIDNTWLPMKPGTQLVFTGTTTEGKEKVPHRLVFTITDMTKEISGVRTVVLWDRDFSSGELVEAEIAFFAQDDDGNLWQLGEHPEEYEEGKIVASPTWIHGQQGARAGLTMQAGPRLGTKSYSLGWGPAVGFNDRARVLRVGQKNCVPMGCYKDVLVVDEYNPDEPGKHQLKYYARGVGNIRVGWLGAKEDSKEELVLVAVRHLSPKEMAAAHTAALKLERSAYKRSKAAYGTTEPLRVP